MKSYVRIALCAALALACAGASAADPVSTADQGFVTQAASAGMAEVALGKMAEGKSHTADVIAFGGMMVRDHGAANAELVKLAKDKGLTVPDGAPSEAEQQQSALQSLLPDAFDEQFLQVMVRDHTQALSLFQQEADTGADKDLRDFATRTLPTIRNHLAQAKALQASTGPAK